MSDYAILSSGNEAEDQEALRRFMVRQELIKAGMCPNGCGGMIEVDAWNAKCLQCSFCYFSSGGLNFQPTNKA